jgi:hypothetical protein
MKQVLNNLKLAKKTGISALKLNDAEFFIKAKRDE